MKSQTNNFLSVKLDYFMYLKAFGERNYTDRDLVINTFQKFFDLKLDYAQRLHISYLHMVSEVSKPLTDRSLNEDNLLLVPLNKKLPKAVQEIEREYVHPIRKETLFCGKTVYTYPSRV